MEFQQQIKIRSTGQLLNLGILIIFFLLYAPILLHWLDGWLHKSISIEHEYFSHGIIGLPFAGYIAWTNRKKWQRLPDSSHPVSIGLLITGVIFYLSGVSEWVNLSLPTILVGLCLWFKGIPGLQLQGFPLLLVFLATPTALPYIIAPYTFPLQSFIASTAAFILNQFGMNVIVDGINLYVNGRIVEVAPYCAGLKMLFTTLYVSLILLYWTETMSSRRITAWFLSIAIVISVTANIIRNTLLTFFHGTGNQGAFTWLHDGWGGDLYSACMLLSLVPLLNWMNSYFPEKPAIELAETVEEA
ncbi:cyanoexosortase B [Anabaena cylindrica FACHB-243]|uniref:Eight transmembrane protein EpsH n=1 Tax=Anabaena cylindrica (strain ATCC 27899 / PCC 7122) TaxID=272123 RepID=K9ZK42_ANACC|nr:MULTISPECIES: cyanoexosortase B [Anabaena]AFZ58917.1 eight transmembrane protein EpsH [Anabaena cylindrica PCC 7122]MBD2419500.1 cyanoexosortase B [Anabaena cylindrica FACHB-243]MBY5283973.1 cyanoexosortase B [Anabaena sp. CCAP 1446/1C]MBY5310799.1 cyanoexosortase B [Anabaena sp. CCAP 1446/1C]MCM2408317.1 cyanoexosortase B [Anabaena sp. CCAP 1446/1C]